MSGFNNRQTEQRYTGNDHTYVVCAYKESPYLKECLDSLISQTTESRIIIATSTPCAYIERLAEEYNVPLYINGGESGIAQDWNFGMSCAKTRIVTIAHQDDIYEPWYTETILKGLSAAGRPLIAFTDYGELRGERRETKNRLLDVKRVLLLPLRLRKLQSNRLVRRRILAFGSAISCPTVSYFIPNLPKVIFEPGYRSDLDWQAWEKLSKLSGDFVFCNRIAMYHRIHEASATTQIIQDTGRGQEDFEMFCKFWPKPVARLLEKIYAAGEKSNSL